jgi:hypothetical protein
MTSRWTYRTSAAGVIVLAAAAAFTLSYDALHQLALDSRVRPALAWLWPVVIDGTIVVALLTVLAAKRAATGAGYPWALAGLFSTASVAFNIAHAPDGRSPSWCSPWPRCSPPTCSCNRLVGDGRQPTQSHHWPNTRPAPKPHTRTGRGDHPALEPPDPNGDAPVGARGRVRAAYQAQLAAGQTPTGAGLARAAGVSERYGQRLLAEFTADSAPTGHHNGDRRARIASQRQTPTATEGR